MISLRRHIQTVIDKKKFSVVTIHNSLIYMVIIVVQTNAKSFISSRQWWGLPSSDGYFLYFGINFPMGPIDNSVSIGSGDGIEQVKLLSEAIMAQFTNTYVSY